MRKLSVHRLLPLCLVAACSPAFALPAACPSTVPSLIALGTGSCTVSGLGTLSNFRFNVSTTNGGVPFSTSTSSLALSPGLVFADFGEGAGGVGAATSTSTYNLAFNLVPPAGNTITGAVFFFNFSFSSSGAAPALGGLESLCLNGVFTAFPPTSCSGTTQTLTVPTFNPATQTPQNPAAITFSANSADVLVTGTGAGGLFTAGGSQTFTITPSATPTPTPSPTPAPSSLVLAIIGFGCAAMYLTWRRHIRQQN